MYTDFEKDSELLDRLIIISAGITQDKELIKQAGIVDSLGGMAKSVHTSVKEKISRDGILATLMAYLSPSFFGLIWGPFKYIIPVASFAGLDISGIFSKVIDSVKSVISNTGDFTKNDASRIADESTRSLSSQASLSILHELNNNGKIVSLAKSGFGKSKSSIIGKVLGHGLLRWFIMAVLIGVASIEGPKLIKEKALGIKDEPFIPGEPVSTKQTKQYDLPDIIETNLKPSGKGTQYHVNSGNTFWIIDMNGSIPNTLWLWAKNIYPEISKYENEVKNSESFNRMVSIISDASKDIGGRNFFKMPVDSELHTWKDVVDRFIGETASKIKG
jgi:hypothetical protein